MNTEPTTATPKRSFSIGRWLVAGVTASAVMIVVACGSDSDDGANGGLDSGADATQQTPPPGPIDAGASDAKPSIECSTPPGFDDCTGKCGPIRNPCTGAVVKQCGGCTGTVDGGSQREVCDLETNSCIKPKVTCADLGAECGRIRNSCGTILDCPSGVIQDNIECPGASADGGTAAQECDPDTHKCRTATSVTCADLGHECGNVWLGAGPKTNTVNCGDCSNHPDRPRCNSGALPDYNICEPACNPPTDKAGRLALCNAAKAARGVECGFITDGCGGVINCEDVDDSFKCKNGETCGTRGIANRCDPKEPNVECIAAGRNCGTIKSACDNSNINCGECTGTDICNENGVCGPPCVPKKCADLGNPECLPSGTPVSDGCGGSVTDCPVCPGGPAACQPAPAGDAGASTVGGVCCVPTFSCTNRPPGVDANACGATKRFDNGCGVQIECNCPGGTCGSDGMCCTASACPAASNVGGDCGSTPLGCGQTCNRGCTNDANGNNNACFNGKCCNPEPDNAGEWRTANPGRCAFNISNGCGGTVDAPCLNGAACIDAETGPGNVITDPSNGTPSAIGYCCTTPNANCNVANACTTVPNACVTGQNVNCGAGQCPDGADGSNDELCFNGACCDPAACPAAGAEGATCGSGSFDRGCGQTCNPGCANDSGGRTNPCFNGQCCNAEPDDANEWRASQPAGACAYNISNGCGGFIDAPCGGGQVCQKDGVQITEPPNNGASEIGTCCTTATSCGGSPKPVGEACVVDNVCLSGSQTVTCSCVGGATCFNGTCCAPSACPAASPVGQACGTVNLGCGQTCNRGCVSGASCFNGSCCAPVACPAAAPIGGTCGGFNRGCGQTCTIQCDKSGGKENNTCGADNKCVCVKKSCAAGQIGTIPDGCGGSLPCGGG